MTNLTPEQMMDLFKAYAAQQNAELVAEVELHKKGGDHYRKLWQELRKQVEGLAKLPDAASKIVSLEAENERLKQQNAELVAANNRLSNMDILMVALQVRIGELQVENERLKQQLAWQPIETAPKDETDVDLWVEIDGLQYRVTNAFYCPDEQCWWGPNEYFEAVKLEKQGLKILYWKAVIKPPKEGE